MRQKATVFEFTSYKFEPAKKRILFNYKTEFKDKKPLFFTETIILPTVPDISFIPKELLLKLLESLHIILGISYYKFYCATKVKLNYSLSKKEADFWNIVYKKGLGEFFYKNKLDFKISPKFPFKKNADKSQYNFKKNLPLQLGNKCLVGIGGGKDSIVLAELLKQNKFDITALYVQTSKKSEMIDKVIETIGIDKLKIQRFLDWQVFQQHQYNGHVPISAIYAFLGILTAVLYKYSYFIIGNEYSSNFGNLKYKGEIINHQWSKSFEFEKLFQDYAANFISPHVYYFSLLRNFYEIRIAKIFSKLEKYFSVFSSCNGNFKVNAKTDNKLWCGNCPKCVFVFILLSAFTSKKDLFNIFKKNLYRDKNLLLTFRDILGFGKMKPFDCIGTFNEAKVALYLARKKYKNDFIIKTFLPKIKLKTKDINGVFKACLPDSSNDEYLIPEQFKFLGMEEVLILGYGKEGKTTKKYFKKYYPNLKIGIADTKQGKNYLERQKNFDIAIKTPGIKKEMVKIPYTTATNIFFSKINQLAGGNNKIIGVTGSKGKSTTSSLIYKILKEAGKNIDPVKSDKNDVPLKTGQFNRVKFLGNIGNPMLEALIKSTPKNTIFILELSSYQLDDIKFSPDIAVVTSLFPEHMDYHENTKNYYEAKKNIINFQNEDNFFVYDIKNKEMVHWLKNYKGRAVPFSKNIPLKNNEIPIIGEHNKNNIKAAVTVAKILNIPDEIIKKAVKNFKGLPHRLEFIGQFNGIKFYDDAISTTPESTIMAIKSLGKIDTILLGGEDRGYNFYQLEKTIKKYKIRNIVLFPKSGNRILKSKKGFNILRTSSMEKAIKFAYKKTKKGCICLLSCASPSYSLWKNFEEKGNEFKKIVKKLCKPSIY